MPCWVLAVLKFLLNNNNNNNNVMTLFLFSDKGLYVVITL
jgi:hypothetical protein